MNVFKLITNSDVQSFIQSWQHVISTAQTQVIKHKIRIIGFRKLPSNKLITSRNGEINKRRNFNVKSNL